MKFFFHSMDLAPRLNVDPARLVGLVLSLVLLPFQASNAAGTGFSPLGERQIPGLTELSGLAVSGLQQDHHWALNDSGHAASLFELDENLNLVREIAISQVLNRDWEDLASFQLDGIPYLLVADTGNNFRLRSEVSLILLREPAPGASRATPERIIRFRFEDGSRDCEALAVDVQNRQILLADKGRRPGGLYSLPLDAESGSFRAIRARPGSQPCNARDASFVCLGCEASSPSPGIRTTCPFSLARKAGSRNFFACRARWAPHDRASGP